MHCDPYLGSRRFTGPLEGIGIVNDKTFFAARPLAGAVSVGVTCQQSPAPTIQGIRVSTGNNSMIEICHGSPVPVRSLIDRPRSMARFRLNGISPIRFRSPGKTHSVAASDRRTELDFGWKSLLQTGIQRGQEPRPGEFLFGQTAFKMSGESPPKSTSQAKN